jgi:NADH-quinone oxidoreductase subunit N
MQIPAGFSQLLDHTQFLLPELIVLVGAFLILILGFFPAVSHRWLTGIALSVLLMAGTLLVRSWPDAPIEFFYEMLRLDHLASALRLLLIGTAVLLCFMPFNTKNRFSEYLFFLLIITLGGNLLVMSIDLLSVVLALEVISLSSYALVGFSFSKASAEGSWKYFLIGSVATAITLFGMSYLFGATGTTQFTSTLFLERALTQPSSLLKMGALLSLAGFLFKIGAAPFHWWAPDAYQSAPVAVTTLLATLPKVAGMGVLIRFTLALHLFGQGDLNWRLVLAGLALVTLLAGNLGGLFQKNALRLMAYSSIAQSGFVLVGLASLTLEGTQTALFYLVTLVVMNVLTFRCLQHFESMTGTYELEKWIGWGRQQLLLTTFLTIGLIALAGLPPTGGFMAKLFVFSTLWQGYQTNGEFLLAVLFGVGLVATVIGLFFYLKAPYFLLIKTPSALIATKKSEPGTLFTWLLVVVILLLFFYPGLLMGWLNRVTFVL